MRCRAGLGRRPRGCHLSFAAGNWPRRLLLRRSTAPRWTRRCRLHHHRTSPRMDYEVQIAAENAVSVANTARRRPAMCSAFRTRRAMCKSPRPPKNSWMSVGSRPRTTAARRQPPTTCAGSAPMRPRMRRPTAPRWTRRVLPMPSTDWKTAPPTKCKSPRKPRRPRRIRRSRARRGVPAPARAARIARAVHLCAAAGCQLGRAGRQRRSAAHQIFAALEAARRDFFRAGRPRRGGAPGRTLPQHHRADLRHDL